jgi:tartrate dehydrogenase/decarboxylase/D-malate dehydrogenase
MHHDVALLPGDGIGPELIDAVEPLLSALADAHGFDVRTTRYEWGAHRYLAEGSVMPDDALDRLAGHDAILFVAMGLPEAENATIAQNGHHHIRKGFDQYINLRRATLMEGVDSPLAGYGAGDVDIAWFRENSEGEYIDAGGRLERGGETELAVQEAVFTRKGVERIVRAAFEAALERDRSVTSVTKSNALPYGPGFWDEVVAEVAEEYPGVTLTELFVDAANMYLVTRPETFDVVVSSNLFGDILTEAAAGVTGGLALSPSANVNPENDYPNMFEPVHGSAPDIAGEGVANPLATVLSAAMLFEDVDEDAAAAALRDAVTDQLADGSAPRTPDLGGDATTTAVVEDLRSRL